MTRISMLSPSLCARARSSSSMTGDWSVASTCAPMRAAGMRVRSSFADPLFKAARDGWRIRENRIFVKEHSTQCAAFLSLIPLDVNRRQGVEQELGGSGCSELMELDRRFGQWVGR